MDILAIVAEKQPSKATSAFPRNAIEVKKRHHWGESERTPDASRKQTDHCCHYFYTAIESIFNVDPTFEKSLLKEYPAASGGRLCTVLSCNYKKYYYSTGCVLNATKMDPKYNIYCFKHCIRTATVPETARSECSDRYHSDLP